MAKIVRVHRSTKTNPTSIIEGQPVTEFHHDLGSLRCPGESLTVRIKVFNDDASTLDYDVLSYVELTNLEVVEMFQTLQHYEGKIRDQAMGANKLEPRDTLMGAKH